MNNNLIHVTDDSFDKDVLQSEKSKYIFAESGRGQSYMVRSETHKLLLCRDDEHSQFFDLQNDPYELNNLYGNPNESAIISEMKDVLSRWALFEAPYPVHTDEQSPTINSKSSRGSEPLKRNEVYAYFKEKMTLDLNL